MKLENELIALVRGADVDVVGLRPVSRRRCIDRRAAARAKCLRAFRSALCRLYVDRRLAAENLEGAVGGADRRAEHGTGQRLAIAAMADRGPLRGRLRLVGDIAAVAPAAALHASNAPCFGSMVD